MLNLLGEHHCKVDPKGRMMFPARLRKLMESEIHHGLVVNRDIFSKCLVLYSKSAWDQVMAEMNRLSRYDEEHQLFLQKFMKGATLVELDDTGRLMLPSVLLPFAEIDLKKNNEIVLTGVLDKMKIWSKDNYEKFVLNDADGIDIKVLAKKVGKDIENRGGNGFMLN
ncbi:MAG: division/cell wall cluster transcriptional repressor MraZ [Flavobacteriales bacterium]|jgi:MraZ protein